MARYDDLNTGAIAYTAFISTVILLIVILLGRALCYALVVGEMERKTANAVYSGSDDEISEQKSILSGYYLEEVPVVTEAGEETTEERLRIPVEEAKKLVFEDLKSTDA